MASSHHEILFKNIIRRLSSQASSRTFWTTIRSLLVPAYFLSFGTKTGSRAFLPVGSATPRCYSVLNDQSQYASGPHILTASNLNTKQIVRLWMRYGRHGFAWDG